MKKWYIIDDITTKRAAIYETLLHAETKEEAEKEALATWEALSDHDKRDRDAFYIALADPDPEDNRFPDYEKGFSDTVEIDDIIKKYKD